MNLLSQLKKLYITELDNICNKQIYKFVKQLTSKKFIISQLKLTAMKLSMKIFANAAFTFAVIGFVTYLCIVIAGFFGCCAGITDAVYYKIILTIVVAAAATFGVCMYNNCYLGNKQKES